MIRSCVALLLRYWDSTHASEEECFTRDCTVQPRSCDISPYSTRPRTLYNGALNAVFMGSSIFLVLACDRVAAVGLSNIPLSVLKLAFTLQGHEFDEGCEPFGFDAGAGGGERMESQAVYEDDQLKVILANVTSQVLCLRKADMQRMISYRDV